MPHILKEQFEKHREVIMYLVFGVLTTAVNYISYLLLARATSHTVFSTAAAWALSVLFAYYTNRKWVFGSKASGPRGVLGEMAAFFAARLFSGLLDIGIMFVFVDLWHYNDSAVKIASNVIVIALNYVFSKLFIFRK